ncbi:MAG TPA: PaaI family thioesterase [Thermoanaerobaculia bacterium]
MSDDEQHWRKLENLYLTAPTNDYYKPKISIGNGVCEIDIAIRHDFFHAANAVHGSVYFKLLDDAGFFAANSEVLDAFVLTANFTIYLLRPVSDGVLSARGRLISTGSRQFLAEAQLFNSDRLVAHGVGTYVRSKILLTPQVGYR